MDKNKWPDSELPQTFDWSLPMSKIEQLYGKPAKPIYQPVPIPPLLHFRTLLMECDELKRQIKQYDNQQEEISKLFI